MLEVIPAMREDLNAAMATIWEEIQDLIFLLAEGYTQIEIAGTVGCEQLKMVSKVSTGRKNLRAAIT